MQYYEYVNHELQQRAKFVTVVKPWYYRLHALIIDQDHVIDEICMRDNKTLQKLITHLLRSTPRDPSEHSFACEAPNEEILVHTSEHYTHMRLYDCHIGNDH